MTTKHAMPLQNRVTPFGEIVAISQRGMFTGNRGIIYDPETKTLLAKRWATRRWLVCACTYKGRRRQVMTGRKWTELFFLDEAVALAAGHRPCFLCRREAAERFRACWASAKAEAPPSAVHMDSVLHAERLDHGRKRLHPIALRLEDLPDGAVVAVGGEAYTLRGGGAHRWTNGGYARPEILDDADWLLTPPSTVMALTAGYRPVFHPSIDATLGRSGNADLFDALTPVGPATEIMADGAMLLRGAALPFEKDLLAALGDLTAQSPFRHMVTPGGFTMSVAMTNCGAAGWVTDRTGYRYDRNDPATGRPWPAMPDCFLELAIAAATRAGYPDFRPDTCLINRYQPGARLTLHQDKNERDFASPIVSVSSACPQSSNSAA